SEKRTRFVAEYGIREYAAQVLTQTRAIGEYFERAAKVSGDPRTAANWIMGELMGALQGRDFAEASITAEHLGELVSLIGSGEISGKLAKDVFNQMLETGEAARAIIDRSGLRQISDTGALGTIIDEVIAANPKQVEQYKSGK